ncbi:MAG: hypothetical protein KKF62_06475 [Bacteroidetes bacterium]|nr:hypothetical protein [Bacteroidota bacterium]MBU1115432.1 hypothetical protein [Bacteroidota bacterium]MBU1797575.1 hypothetical protein [Bacteroidota bacterium]
MNKPKIFNNLSKLILSAIILVSSSLIAQPRQDMKHPPIPDEKQIMKMVDELSTDLDLNSEQKTQITELFKNHFAELKTKMENHELAEQKDRQEMEGFRDNFAAKVKSILTEEQKLKFDDFMKNHEPNHGQKPEHMRPRD